jgi:hypothetical protein
LEIKLVSINDPPTTINFIHVVQIHLKSNNFNKCVNNFEHGVDVRSPASSSEKNEGFNLYVQGISIPELCPMRINVVKPCLT